MSGNALLNSLIALIEERSKDAREFLRASSSQKLNVGEVYTRLSQALTKSNKRAQIKALKNTLSESLRTNNPPGEWSESAKEAYYKGVTDMEETIDVFIEQLESEILA